MKRILVYGDSNTWGYISGTLNPKTFYCERYSPAVRWTGLLQKNLGPEYFVIEEGLPGRTIAADNAMMPHINGMKYLTPCLLSHRPIDLVIIMLGTNDLKTQYDLSPATITEQLHSMCQLIHSSYAGQDGANPAILIIAPPVIISSQLSEDMHPFYIGVDARSQEISACYADLAKKEGYLFCDASQLKLSSQSDGLHLDEEAHLALAEMLENQVRDALNNTERPHDRCANE